MVHLAPIKGEILASAEEFAKSLNRLLSDKVTAWQMTMNDLLALIHRSGLFVRRRFKARMPFLSGKIVIV